MFKFVFRTALLITLLAVFAGSALAQNAPQPVLDALKDLNQRMGQQWGIGDVNFLWEEKLFNNEALGCSRLNTGNLQPKSIIGYQVSFLFNNGTPEYDYRISYTPAIFVLCSPYTPPTATPTPVPPTPIPSATVNAPQQATPVPAQPTVFVPPQPVFTATPSSCPGFTSRLQIGIQARVTSGGANNLRESAAVSTRLLGTIPAEGVFIVQDGPRCTGDGMWWQVNFNGTIGWTVEGRGSDYYVEPLSMVVPPTPLPTALPTMTPPPVICNAAIPPRLHIGLPGRVTPGGIPNNVRDQPGKSARLTGEIPPEGVFAVLDGPVCTGDGAWFQVNYNNLVGWTLEGMESDYWLEPLGGLEKISATTLPRLRPLASWTGANAYVQQVTDTMILASDRNLIMRWTLTNRYATPDTLAWSRQDYTLEEGTRAGAVTFIAAQNRTLALSVGAQFKVMVLETGEVLATLPAYTDLPSSAFSPDGRWLAIAYDPHGLVVVPLDGTLPGYGIPVTLPDTHAGMPGRLTFSNDGTQMLSFSNDKIIVWDVATWGIVTTYDISQQPPFDYLDAVAFSPDKQWVAFGTRTTTGVSALIVWHVGVGSATYPVRSGDTIYGLAFTPDSLNLISSGLVGVGGDIRHGHLEMRDLATGIPVTIADNTPEEIASVRMNPEGSMLVTSSATGPMQVWVVQP